MSTDKLVDSGNKKGWSLNSFQLERTSLCISVFTGDVGGLKMKSDNLGSVPPTLIFLVSLPPPPFFYCNLWHTHGTLNARYRLVVANILQLKGQTKAYCFSLLVRKHFNVGMWLSLDLKILIKNTHLMYQISQSKCINCDS